MAEPVGALRASLSLDSAAFERGVNRANSSMGDLGRRINRTTDRMTQFSRQGGKTAAAMAGFGDAMKRAALQIAAASGVIAGVRSLGAATEQYAKMTNSLRAMGVEAEQVAGVMQSIGDIANRTRSPLEATATLYQRISIAGRDLGASQQQVLRFTENVGLALAQTGTSSTEAAGALLQLSQAMSGGVVRAEEFNSILEGAFPIAQAAANAIDGAAGSVGRLRTMVVDGEVSSREFFEAILSQTDALEEAFANTVPTISQSLGVLSNNFTMFVGQMDQATGISAGISQAILLLSENIDRVAAYAASAAVVIGGAYAGGIALAAARTVTFSGALLVLRGALIRTGIGALVVGAGELAFRFSRLVEATGGWGEAMSLLGEVVAGVWEGIKTSASSIPKALEAHWQLVKSDFLVLLSNLASNWARFMEFIGQSGAGADAFAHELMLASGDAADEWLRLSNEAEDAAADGFAKASEALAKLRVQTDEAADSSENGSDAVDALNDALGGLDKGGKKAGKGLEKALSETEAFDKAMKEAALSAEDLGRNKANILISGVDSLSDAFGDFTARGFRDFKGFTDSIVDSFQSALAQMISMAARNQIMIGLGFGGQAGGIGGLIPGGAAQVAGAGQSGLGLLQGVGPLANLLGGGGALSGIASGVGGILSGGGLGASFANLGGLLSGAAAGWGAVGAAIPAVAAVAAAISFFSSKTKLLDSGLRITVDNVDTLVESFKHLEKRRFWGLSKKRRYEYSVLDDDEAEPYVRAIDSIWDGVLGGAEVLGVASSAWDDFTSQITVSTKGLSEEEAAEAVQEALSGLSDEMAGVVPGLEELTRYGETATNALTRLSTSLVAVNDVFDLLGHSAYEANIAGADLASQLVDLFGGVDAMAGATNSYFAAFYSEAERLEIQTRRVSDAFGELGLALPASREEFRALVEALDLTTSGGQEMYAAFLSLSGALDQVLPQVSSLTTDIAGIISGINGEIGLQMDAAREAQRNAESAARLWFRTAETLRDFIRDISGNSQLSGLGLSATHEINRSRFGTAFEMARGGDIDAASDIPALARSYLETARQSASTDLEYRRIAAQVKGQVAELGGIAALEGAQDDLLRALHEQQIDVLTALQSYLNTSGVTEDGLAEFGSALDNLDTAITNTSAAQIQSLGAFGGSISDFVGSVGQVGDQIGIHLSDFVLGIPSEMDLDSTPLQSSLDLLRDAIEADAEERERQMRIAALQSQGGTVANVVADRAAIGAGIVSDIQELERRTGVQLLRNGNLDATLNVGAQGYINYAADYFSGSAEGIADFRAAFYGPNGLQAQIGAHNAHAVSGIGQLEALREQIRALGGIPSFDGGGFTGYGPRTGGLDGKGGFLSLLHRNEFVTDLTKAPSYRPAAGFGENRVIEGLLRRILKENAEERSEKRQLLRHIAISNERILKLEKRRDAQSEVNA